MPMQGHYDCPHGCLQILKKNKGRHNRRHHPEDVISSGRPKKHRPRSTYGDDEFVDASHGEQHELQRQNNPPLIVPRSQQDWWAHESWYQEICGKRYYWNRNGFLEKLLQLPRLDPQTSSEDDFIRFINPRDLPDKSEADALRALQNHHSELKFYSMGQFDDAAKNQTYPGEYHATLLLNMLAPPRSKDPRYAKIPLDELEFDYSRAPIDGDFLYCPQQGEMFASPAGSWSDIHIDHFLAGLAMPVGDTIKLFTCWPACEHNLKLLDEEPPGPERLMHIFDRLEGGQCAIATKYYPVYLRKVCLHAVGTVRGGFMYAGNFIIPDDGPSFLRGFRFSPAFIGRYDTSGRKGLMANLLAQVQITLGKSSCWAHMVAEMTESWSAVEKIGQTSDMRTLAEQFLEVFANPLWQEKRDERSDLDATKLEGIIRAQLERASNQADAHKRKRRLVRSGRK